MSLVTACKGICKFECSTFSFLFIFVRPFPLNLINVTEKMPVGEIIARVKATDRDEDSSITYSFKTQQEVFRLDPGKF